MMKSLITFAAFALIITPAFAGEVKCEKVARPAIATGSKDFEQVTVERTAIPGKESVFGYVGIEVFGLTAEDAAILDNGDTAMIEACDTPEGPSLRFKVRAYPDNGSHIADIALPAGAKGLRVRWCSKSEGCQMQGTYTGGGAVELQGTRRKAGMRAGSL